MKVTKGHFNRKVLFFGLLLFLAISLISTGFAAWIMSTGTDKGSNSNVHVGTITDGSLEFGEIKFVEDKEEIIFDSLESDTDGHIYADLSENALFENLSVTFTTTLTPVTYVKDLSISVALPATVKAAADAKYITMPKCCHVEGTSAISVDLIKDGVIQKLEDTGVVATITTSEDGKIYNISITLNFGWGTAFGGKNPGIYLDDENDDVDFSYEQKVQKMVEFKSTIYGLSVAEEGKAPTEGQMTKDEVFAYTTPLEFKITLNAVAK